MALDDSLCGLSEVKAALDMEPSYSADDDQVTRAISAATAQIHDRCDRFFTNVGDTATARVFSVADCDIAHIDDFHTTTDLAVAVDSTADGTFDQTWTNGTDFQLEPLNGYSNGIQGHPYNTLRAIGTKSFKPSARARLQVTAKWGWAAVPDPVREAAVIQSVHVFKASSAALGVAGFGDVGVIRLRQALHPTAEALIARYARYPIPFA